MSYLIDTNVLSELRRRQPDPGVRDWFSARPATSLYLSTLTLGELREGVEALAAGERRLRLLDWLEADLPAFFSGRILAVDAAVAKRWGRLQAEAARPLPAFDSLLAATALHFGLRLVPRNLRDFAYPGLEVINAWQTSVA